VLAPGSQPTQPTHSLFTHSHSTHSHSSSSCCALSASAFVTSSDRDKSVDVCHDMVMLVDSCCTLLFIPRRHIPLCQMSKMQRLDHPVRYSTSNGHVECWYCVVGLLLGVESVSDEIISISVSGDVSPDDPPVPFLLAGSVVSRLLMEVGKSPRVWLGDIEVSCSEVNGMPAVRFSHEVVGSAQQVALVCHVSCPSIVKFPVGKAAPIVDKSDTVEDRVVSWHRRLGHTPLHTNYGPLSLAKFPYPAQPALYIPTHWHIIVYLWLISNHTKFGREPTGPR